MATFYNQATLTYNGITKSSNMTVGEITDVITAGKNAASDTYAPGDTIVYVISMVNTGSTELTGLTITDDLGEYEYQQTSLIPLTYVDGSLMYYVNGALQTAPEVTSAEPLTVEGISIPAGGSALMIYEAAVNGFASPEPGGTITNTAGIAAGSGAALAEVTETVSASAAALLDIGKSVAPQTVAENGSVTYTFIIENTGSAPAGTAENAVISDVFDPALTGLTVTFNGAAWTAGTQYTYDEASGAFATAAGQITVPAAQYDRSEQGSYIVTPGISTLTVTGTLVPSQQQPKPIDP